jgi:hypothetical protein
MKVKAALVGLLTLGLTAIPLTAAQAKQTTYPVVCSSWVPGYDNYISAEVQIEACDWMNPQTGARAAQAKVQVLSSPGSVNLSITAIAEDFDGGRTLDLADCVATLSAGQVASCLTGWVDPPFTWNFEATAIFEDQYGGGWSTYYQE